MKIQYYLDTNVCIHYLNDSNSNVVARLEASNLDDVKIPSIVAAELYYGVHKSARREHNLSRLRLFLDQFEAIQFCGKAAAQYGEIRAALERSGKTIGWNDLLIAATAKAGNATLVTNNTKEFSRIDGLLLEDWSASQTMTSRT